jgi:CRP-like cAMP-binding protein
MTSADQDILQRVAAHPFLSGMTAPQIHILADCAQLQQFAPEEMLFRAGDPARGFYLVESGSVSVEGEVGDQPAVVIDTVSAGEPLGWSWMFEPYICEYSARATQDTTALFIDALRLADHRGGDLTLGHELFKRMSNVMVRRLSAARAKLLQSRQG